MQKTLKKEKNIAVQIVNKIKRSLVERPYGKHTFSAAIIMRESMLIGSMLNNSENWINLTKKNVENLEKPDVILLRKILSSSGNPSTVFMYLELGIFTC